MPGRTAYPRISANALETFGIFPPTSFSDDEIAPDQTQKGRGVVSSTQPQVVMHMSITPAELRMVQESLDALRDEFDTHSTYFYDALFRHAPHLRKLFRDDLTGQGMKFMTTLNVIVQKPDQEDDIAEQFTGLGRTHASLGVRSADFAPMEEALVDTIRNAMGDEFSSELEHAWRKAYAIVSSNMIRRGNVPT